MESNLSQDRINRYLEKISSHELFVRTPRYAELLRILVDATLRGEALKEVTLGMQFFGDNYAQKNDGLARTYVYNLRKRLDQYYSNEGKDDELKFILIKGSYQVHFREVSNIEAGHAHISKSRIKLLLVATLAVALAIVATVMISHEKSYCWQPFFDNERATICILADHLTWEYTPTGRKSGSAVNNDIANYTRLQNKLPDSLKLRDYTFLTKCAPFALHRLTEWFCSHDSTLTPILESSLPLDQLKGANIIYIGQYKLMGVSRANFLKDSKVFRAGHNCFYSTRDGIERVYSHKFKKTLESEFAMVSYVALNTGGEALYFISNHDMGTIATVERFLDRDFLKDFFSTIPKGAHFNALFKVAGLGRTEISCELIDIEIIE